MKDSISNNVPSNATKREKSENQVIVMQIFTD